MDAAATGKRKADAIDYAASTAAGGAASSPQKGTASKKKSKPTDSAKVQARLEANRKAARESRRRKKVLVEELQRSVIFFSRANGQLKQKNEELERMFIQAQAQIAARNGATTAAPTTAPEGGQEVQEGEVTNNDPVKAEGGGEAIKADPDGGNDAADTNPDDVPLDEALTSEDPNSQQQTQETTNVPIQMVQHPIPFTAVPGGAAMDPNTMMYMMMMSGMANNPMMANPMMALQMFNQLNASGAMAGGVANVQQQSQTQGTANNNAATPAAAAPAAAFPAMPVGNVLMPTPGGAFNPFLGGAVQQGAFTAMPSASNAAAPATEGASSSSAAPAGAEEVDV